MIFRIFKKFSLFLLSILFCLCLLSLVSENMNSFVFSNDLEKKESELEEKKKEKEEALSQLEQVKNEITRIQNSGYSLDQQIRLIDVEVKRVEDEMKKVEEGIVEREGSIVLKEEDLNEKQDQVEKISEKLYKNSRMSFLEILFRQGGDDNFVQTLIFNRFVIASQISYMKEVAEEMRDLEEEKKELEKQKEVFEKDRKDFEESKGLLAKEKVRIQGELNKQVATRGVLTKRIESIETQITHLLEEQREAARREAALLSAAPPPQSTSPPEIPQGGFYISGRGRDLYQGHGVGMSQWGAYGGAEKGMTAQQILNFYYTNVRIEADPGKVTVDGKTMDQNVYVAGLGEVPSKACGTDQQATERPDKYVVKDPSNPLWSCWPEEAIKAQVIAARSYGRYQGSLCSTASCQVYLGGNAKQWAAEETKDLVIKSNSGTHAGGIINAVYSSDNSQGAGTANNETVWQNFKGENLAYTYLRSVNDNSFARATQWTYWHYQTQGYTYDDVLEMLKSQALSHPRVDSLSKNNISAATKINDITFERDPSGRVVKMLLYFDSSSTPQPIGGWWFKNFWNIWQGSKGGSPDYIYSQTFYFNHE